MASPEHKRCLGCGYILDHLPEPRCPECGREFDLRWRESYLVGEPSRPGGLHLFLALAAPAAVALAAALVPLGEVSAPRAFAVAALGLCVELYVACRSRHELRKPVQALPRRTFWRLALLVSALLLLGYALLGVATCYGPRIQRSIGSVFLK